jgi:recombination associated protein RdgC
MLPGSMPVLSGAVTFSRFRSEPTGNAPSDVKRWLAKGLKSGAFEPIDLKKTEDERAAGFVELENPDSVDFSTGSVLYGEYALFGFRVDTVKVPAAVLKAELGKWATSFEKQNGRAPTRGEKAENRASLRHMLRQRAVPSTKVHDVSWNLKTSQVQLWAASRKAVDEILLALETAFEVKLQPLVPASLAARAGIADDALIPTPELIGVEIAHSEIPSSEVAHGEA